MPENKAEKCPDCGEVMKDGVCNCKTVKNASTRGLWDRLTNALSLRGFFQDADATENRGGEGGTPEPIQTNTECVINADGVCANCGGPGGKPGPCSGGDGKPADKLGSKLAKVTRTYKTLKKAHADALKTAPDSTHTTRLGLLKDKANDRRRVLKGKLPRGGWKMGPTKTLDVRNETPPAPEAQVTNQTAEPTMSKEALDFLTAAPGGTFSHGGKTFTFNCGTQKFEEVRPAAPAPTDNMTDAEWLGKAPPGIKAAVANAMTITAREEKAVRDQLTAVANAETNPARKAMIVNKLATNPGLTELNDLLVLVGSPVANSGFGPAPVYYGPAGSPGLAPAGPLTNADGSIPDLEPTPYNGPIAQIYRETNAKATA